MLTMRPERLRFADADRPATAALNRISATVTEAVFAGERCRYILQVPGGTSHGAEGTIQRRRPPPRGGRNGRGRVVRRGYRSLSEATIATPHRRAPRRAARAPPPRPGPAGRAAGPLHAGLLRRPRRRDAAAQRRRTHLDARATTAALAGDTVFLQRVLDHAAHRHRRHRRHAAARLSRRPGAGPRPPHAPALVLVLVLLPFWTSVLVRSYAWMVLLGRHGLINEALLAAGLIDAPAADC